MQETNISISTALWMVTGGFVLAGTMVGLTTNHLVVAIALMAHGLVCSAAAATATVRGYFIEQNRLLADVLLGRDGTGGVRQMHGRG